MKKIAIAAAAVCLIGLGAFANKFFAPTANGFYKNSNGTCIAVTLGAAKFQAVVGTDPQATITDKTGAAPAPIYLDNHCTAGQEAEFVNP